MNKLRIVCAAFFVAALALLGVYMVRDKTGQDREEPVITIDGDLIEVSVEDGEEILMQGVTASDAEDGDLTDKVIVESIGRFGKDGRRTITYAVVDSDSLVGHATRKLAYTDYTPPRFSMDKPLSFGMGTTNLTSRIYAYDCLDGDVTSSIKLTSEEGIEVNQSGIYKAQLKASNSAGATTILPVNVEIYDPTVRSSVPLITLSDYVIYITKGEVFDPVVYLQSVMIKGTEYAFTSEAGTYSATDAPEGAQGNTINYGYAGIESNVNPEVAGNYEVQYTFSDGMGITGMTTLYVVVTEGGAE